MKELVKLNRKELSDLSEQEKHLDESPVWC